MTKDKATKTISGNAVDAYLAGVPEQARMSLVKLRETIRAAAPMAEEVLSYGVPAFKYNGMLVSLGAAKKHCAFYVMSYAVMETMKDELSEYDTSPGTIRFPFDKPLPAALVKKIVKARMQENEANAGKKKK